MKNKYLLTAIFEEVRIVRVLITGGKGQLGIELKYLLENYYEVYAWDLEELDITQREKTINEIRSLDPDLVINCAAYTDVDGCEENADLAYKINAYGARNIAVACQEIGSIMVHISTDFVFDGNNDNPYIESDQANPLNIYGKSKLIGEEFVSNLLDKYFIIRTAWLYGAHGDNFIHTMLRLANKKDLLTVVDDQIGSPTYTKDLALVIKKLIATKLYGLYHASNNGQCSWYEFAKKIFEYTNTNVKVKPVTSKEFIRTATRPAYSVLKNYSLEENLNYKMRDWQEALKDYLNSKNEGDRYEN